MSDIDWTQLHGRLLGDAFRRVLGTASNGTMAFVRCLTPDVVQELAADQSFAPLGWQVFRVSDEEHRDTRTVTADHAVEIREEKDGAVLLLVDTNRAGAGMDGIYSAAQEVKEAPLFREALRVVRDKIERDCSVTTHQNAKMAINLARRRRGRDSLSQWSEFDFYCRVASNDRPFGQYLHLVGLWPILESRDSDALSDLYTSHLFVERLLGSTTASQSPAARIRTMRLDSRSKHKYGNDLERFLYWASTKPQHIALQELFKNENLWIGNLKTDPNWIDRIELVPWRNSDTGAIEPWSGLVQGQPPVLRLPNSSTHRPGNSIALEVRWKVEPPNLEEGRATYLVAVNTQRYGKLASQEVIHTGRATGEKCRFTIRDFAKINMDETILAKVSIRVTSHSNVDPQESEEFLIQFADILPPTPRGILVRTLSEGLADAASRESASKVSANLDRYVRIDPKNFIRLKIPTRDGRQKSFRVFRPSLVAEVEEQWVKLNGALGRWTVAVHSLGDRARPANFEPFQGDSSIEWERARSASRLMVKRFNRIGGVCQVYDEAVESFSVVQEYLNAWIALLKDSNPLFSLVNTVEVQSLSGDTLGLIVLPSHPLRVAWHAAYDNLVFHTAFSHVQNAEEIRKEFAALDGARFPAFLPNPDGRAFVFADTLRFHVIGMIPDSDKEPRATMAILRRALEGIAMVEDTPIVDGPSSEVLTREIIKYLECHDISQRLHLHALRAGDGKTVVRSLGDVHRHFEAERDGTDEDAEDTDASATPVFSVDLYPSPVRRAMAGRFITDTREKRRSRAGVIAPIDQWMLDSLPLSSGITIPRLRWARKEFQYPNTAAHLAIAFDSFESRVVLDESEPTPDVEPHYVFGLLSFYKRHYLNQPMPIWISDASLAVNGEMHPSRRDHTEVLVHMQNSIQCTVGRHLGDGLISPVLKTELSSEGVDNLSSLHRLCDWVITLGRNVGIEYFDSPHEDQAIYGSYVIDCVPERDDFSNLQLITSTTNLEEVHNLLDSVLDQMGIGHNKCNARFIFMHLKALSGRLAMRLTGNNQADAAELVALGLSYAHSRRILEQDFCWVSLSRGFIVPLADIIEILPIFGTRSDNDRGLQNERTGLIYVTTIPKQGLVFEFIEVRYRRHLRDVRSLGVLDDISDRVQKFRRQWYQWCQRDNISPVFRAIRRAKLARVLQFYVDKAHRYYMPTVRYREILAEISSVIRKGSDYVFTINVGHDRGWIFCPEYSGRTVERVSPSSWRTRIFLFGPSILADYFSKKKKPFSEELDSGEETNLPSADDDRAFEHEAGLTQGDESGHRSDEHSVIEDAGPVLSVCLGTDSVTNARVDLQLEVKGNPHLLIAGQPGMGKTSCLVNLCKQMVASDVRPIVFSYHQDIDLRLEDAIGEVRFVDFDGLGFNPLQIFDRTSRIAHLDVAATIRDIFSAVYPELGDIQGDRIRQAIKESFEEAGWISNTSANSEPPFKRFVEILRTDASPGLGLRNLLARLGELDDYGFFDIGGESLGSLWECRQPVVVRVHTTQNDNLQKAFAYLVFYGLYKDMFRRGLQQRVTHALIFDEAHRAARLKLIPKMAKECRKYGISFVLASQEARDFGVSVFSAIANYLIFRLTDRDARSLIRNVSNSRQERELVDRIKQMQRFHALYFSESESDPLQIALSPPLT